MNSPNQLSFLPDDYLFRKRARRTNIICGALFVITTAAVGGTFLLADRQRRTLETEHAQVEQQYAEAARRIEQVHQMQDKQRKMALQAELTSSLLEKVPRSFLLAEITNSMPASVSLLDFNLESRVAAAPPPKPVSAFDQQKQSIEDKAKNAGPALPQPKLYDVYLKLTGVARTDVQVAQFINRLSTSRLLKDVNLVISDEYMSEKEKLRKFQIECMVNPTARVSTEEAAAGGPDGKRATAAVELGTK